LNNYDLVMIEAPNILYRSDRIARKLLLDV